MLTLETPIEKTPRMTAYFLSRLKNLGIKTVGDLLRHLPVRYEDFRETYNIADLQPNQEATIHGIIKKVSNRHAWKRRMVITEAIIEDETGRIRAVWFNQSYIQNQLKIGNACSLSGKIKTANDELQLVNPLFERGGQPEENLRHTGRLVPIYPETRGLTSKGIRYYITLALDALEKLRDPLPTNILEKEDFPSLENAIHDIHFPNKEEDSNRARKRFIFEDLFLLQLYNIDQKLQLAAEHAPAIPIQTEEVRALLQTLPFELTVSQKKSLWKIMQDAEKSSPMNRLLQGDVGSGKTIIVAIIAILAGKKGYQTALMAPTEILARQHYQTLIKLFPLFESGIALITGSEARISYGSGLETKTKKEEIVRLISENKIKIAIGTHALIQKNIAFKNLALIIIDEQHRFGVRQRAELTRRGEKNLPTYKPANLQTIPHFLSMSATPIPRTLSLTLWGDLNLSLITELPKNRKPIITKAVSPKNRKRAYAFIQNEIRKGRQAFVICPRIEKTDSESSSNSSPNLEIKYVTEEYNKLSKEIFPNLKIEMLHGKMKPKEKENIMRRFKEGKANVLVSTSVVEVGVDIPNATVMMIEGAEQFGLAQLYQFRGRVGRGEHQSFCFLFTEQESEATKRRLEFVATAKNGLELAEYDLKLRGPGEFLGEVQTGMPDIAMKALQHPKLVNVAREYAKELLEKDKTLISHPFLKKKLTDFQIRIHWE